MTSQRSLQVPTSQSASGQRHRRLAHTRTTSRPAMARSRTFTRRRPWPTARVPHELHPTTSAVVSTCSQISPSTSSWAPTTNPGMPSNAVAPSLRCFTVRGLLFCSRRTAAEWRGPWPWWWIYDRGSGLTPPHASPRRANKVVVAATSNAARRRGKPARLDVRCADRPGWPTRRAPVGGNRHHVRRTCSRPLAREPIKRLTAPYCRLSGGRREAGEPGGDQQIWDYGAPVA